MDNPDPKSVAPSPWTYEDENADIVDGNDQLIADVLELRDDHHATGKLMAAAYLLPECVQALRQLMKADGCEHEECETGEWCKRIVALLAQLEQALP